MARLYHALTDPRITWIAAVAAAVLLVLLWALAGASGGGMSVIGLQLAFTPENFLAVVEGWGAAGVAQFQQTIWLDYLFPVAYAVLLASLLARLTAWPDRPPDRARLILFALPFVAALCDYLENALHLILLSDPPVFPAGTVLLASVVAAIKWVLIGLSAVVIVLLLIRRRRTLAVYG